LGPKGNVQVIVPHQSESYASSADPPEPAIPVCTLKNFPYAIAHTIQWGRDLFEGLFEQRPSQANDFASSLQGSTLEDITSSLLREKGDDAALTIAEELSEDFSAAMAVNAEDDFQLIRDDSLKWASELASKLYFDAVHKLMRQHPLDSLDEDEEEPFWSGIRRPPKALSYLPSDDSVENEINANLVDFVRSAARLRVETFVSGANASISYFTPDQAISALHSVFDTCASGGETIDSDSNQPVAELIRARLKSVSACSWKLSSAEFEKDDDSNGHVSFVNAASNLRAIAYGIPPVDAMETRRVAGNIVPAMITTTAFVSALSCIELAKLVQHAPLKRHRNAFINLALPFFAFTEPLPAEQIPGLQGRKYTLWDRLTVTEGKKAALSGGMTMRALIRRIKKKVATEPDTVEVSSVSYGPYMLFMNFLHDEDENLMDTPLWQLIADAVASGDEFDNTFSRDEVREEDGEPKEPDDIENFVDLSVVVEDVEAEDEAELSIRVKRFGRE
jgi:ubiquitin-activating enzyme E1